MSKAEEAVKEGAKKVAEKAEGNWVWIIGLAVLLIVAIVGGCWLFGSKEAKK